MPPDPCEHLVAIAHLVFARRLTDASGGNLSLRQGARVYMSPAKAGSKQQWQIGPGDVVTMDLQGNVVEGPDRRTREWQMHLGIYRAFERAGGIIHAQAGYLMAFVAAGKAMPPVLEHTRKFGTVGLMAHAHKVPVLIDSRGPVLRHALKARPQVLKLNLAELQQSFSSPLGPNEVAAVDPVAILKTGVQLAVCTMGEQGALAFAGEGRWVLLPPRITMRSSAGSGDAFTAALLVWREKGADWPAALRWATAAGAAKACEARTDFLDLKRMRALYPRVKVKPLGRETT